MLRCLQLTSPMTDRRGAHSRSDASSRAGCSAGGHVYRRPRENLSREDWKWLGLH
jgi:hypothetical protein